MGVFSNAHKLSLCLQNMESCAQALSKSAQINEQVEQFIVAFAFEHFSKLGLSLCATWGVHRFIVLRPLVVDPFVFLGIATQCLAEITIFIK